MQRTPMFQRFTLFLVECVLGCSWNVLGPVQTQKIMYTMSFKLLGTFLLNAMRIQVLLGRLLGRPVGRPGAAYVMHTDVSSFLMVIC